MSHGETGGRRAKAARRTGARNVSALRVDSRTAKKTVRSKSPDKKKHAPRSNSQQSNSRSLWLDFSGFAEAFRHCSSLPNSVLLSSFFINFLGLALPLVILQVFDRILPNQSTDTLLLLVLGLSFVVCLEGFMKIARAQVMSWAALRTGYAAEIEAVGKLLSARKSEYGKDAEALWIDRLDALVELNGFYGGPARLVLIDLPFVAIFLVVIALVGGPLVLVPLFVIACFAGLSAVRGRQLQKLLGKRSEQDGRRYDFIVECLKGINSIKSMAMEPAMQRRFERLQRTSASISYKMILHSNAMQTAGNLFANVAMVSLVTVGALAVMNGYLSIGALACCSLLSGRVVQPVLKGLAVWSELQNVTVCRERAAPLFALSQPETTQQRRREIRGAITLRNITREKLGGAGHLFDRINLNIGPGQIIGIRGEDGTGRSSLLDIMRGEVLADAGSVHIDGLNVVGPAYQQVSNSICYVNGDAPVFRGTVLDNLTMFRSGDAIDAARGASRLIGLEEAIHALPEGYDTFIGEGVSDLVMGGMQQRIAIARVLARNPKILLFDEANSMVDMESDRLLRNGLAQLKGKMTIVLVSNRPSFLAISDGVYQLDGGRLRPAQPNGDPIQGVGPALAKMTVGEGA